METIVFDLEKTRILLVKRASHLATEPGKWALPGGYVDRDEVIVDAARREVLEETGHTVATMNFINYLDNPNRSREDNQNITFVYWAVVKDKVQEPDDESDEVRWFELDGLPSESDFAFDHYEVIQSFTK